MFYFFDFSGPASSGGASWIELIKAFGPYIAAFVAWMLYKQHGKKAISENIIAKEVEKLYEAVDSFFEFSDSVNLYFSLKHKSLEMRLREIQLVKSFCEKEKAAEKRVFDNMSLIWKSSFIMRAIGAKEVAKIIDSYREECVRLRKEIIEKEKIWSDIDNNKAEEFLARILTSKDSILALRLQCLDAVASHKSNLKAP